MDKKTEIALKYVTCRCDEAYKSRGLTAPDCPYHSTDPESAMDEWAEPYIEIADLISRIFYHGQFKAETRYERLLEQKLTEVGLWPTTEDEIIKRKSLTND